MWRFVLILSAVLAMVASGPAEASDNAVQVSAESLSIRPFEENSTDLFQILEMNIEARKAYEARDFNKAARHYSLLVKYDPSFMDAVIGLAKTQIALGRYDLAKDTLSKNTETSKEIEILKALVSAKTMAPKRAVVFLERASGIYEDARLLNLQGELAIQTGKPETARQVFQKAEALGQRQGLLSNNLAMLAFHQGDLDAAIEHLSDAVKIAPDSVKFDDNRRLMLLLKAQYVEALESLSAERSIDLLTDAAIIAEKRGEAALADLFLTQAQKINPRFSEPNRRSILQDTQSR